MDFAFLVSQSLMSIMLNEDLMMVNLCPEKLKIGQNYGLPILFLFLLSAL